jgi:hypothetical protein
VLIYLSGAVSQMLLANPRPDLGIMLQPGMGNIVRFPFVKWAADNGCFAKGADFNVGDWLEWLASVRKGRETCLFGVAPDVLGDAIATLERSRPYLPTIRQLGYPSAFVTQDGCCGELVPWDEMDAMFVGGSDRWKFCPESRSLIAEAKRRGKWVHMGRVNSYDRMTKCLEHLCDSADGTFVAFGPDQNVPKLFGWLDRINGKGPQLATQTEMPVDGLFSTALA